MCIHAIWHNAHGRREAGNQSTQRWWTKHASSEKSVHKALANGHQQQAEIRSEMGDWELRHKNEDSNDSFQSQSQCHCQCQCQPTTNRTLSDSISQIHKNEWVQCGSRIPKSSDIAERTGVIGNEKSSFAELTLKWWNSLEPGSQGSLPRPGSLEDDGCH